ncbi:mucin-2 [Neoarius graeffei]|uniref:mucin-2 n=1 Tax=Neoarius graeffei TaxID=443677 RepID=UPI00298CC1DA|nr:mucin-2 [Neoarius graeffei]
MMKTSIVSLTVWFTQVLTLCALHENLLTTPELEVSTRSENLTTNKDVRTETATTDVMTTTESADELLSDQTSPLTSMLELSGSTSSVEDDRRNNTISTSHHNIMSLNETAVSTNTTSVAMEYQETGTGPENASINIQEMTEFSTSGTSIQLDLDVQTTTSMSWTEDRTSDTDEANTSKVPLIYSTYETDVTLTNGSDGTTDHQSPSPTTAGTYLEILSTNQTPPDDTIRPTGTSGHIKITATPVLSTQVTSGSTENTEEPLVSSMEMMDWKTEENTKALTTTQGNVYNNTTWRDGAWSTNTEDTWSTNTTMSKNVPTSEMETAQWTNCFTKGSSSQPRHFSKLVCFVTLWTLGMIASISLGLTVFLWVRLSVTKKRAKFGGQRQKNKKGHRPTVKEKENLWAEPDSSTEERVEFWYADGATVEENKRRNRSRQARTRSNGERQAGTEEDMWIQPTVTLKDITEFWYTKGRVRRDEETRCELNEDGV